jgi:phosphoribosylanthranilate isomerase
MQTSNAVFRVKICGIQSICDARAVADAGGDAVGFNFYPRSDRFIEPQAADAVAGELPSTVCKVGVFVNETARSILEISRLVGLDCVQLHGDEKPSLLAELPASMAVVRAIRIGSDGFAKVAEFLDRCRLNSRLPDAVLIDSLVPGVFGGTGQRLDWREVAEKKALFGKMPLILAGGLTAENVRSAIETARPSGVDTASGVEVSAGVKDHDKVRRFIFEAKAAFADQGVGWPV